VLRAQVTLPASCRDVLVLRPGDFAAGGAAEIFPAPHGWRVQWSQPIRGQRPWSTLEP
jgi:competence protein ComEC